MRKINNKKGFSMIELLVAVAVLGIFTAFAIPLFGSLIQSQNASICNLNQLTVYESYLIWENEADNRSKTEWEEEYPDEVALRHSSNPFLSNASSYNSKDNTLEQVFRQSFIDELRKVDDFTPTCAKEDSYYVISWNGSLQITCYDKNGDIEQGHNNSTKF